MYSKYSLQKSTEQRKIVAFQVRRIIYTSKIAEQGTKSLLGSQCLSMGVFSRTEKQSRTPRSKTEYDFSAVDFREELC